MKKIKRKKFNKIMKFEFPCNVCLVKDCLEKDICKFAEFFIAYCNVRAKAKSTIEKEILKVNLEMIKAKITTITGCQDGDPIVNFYPDIIKELNDYNAGKIPTRPIFNERNKNIIKKLELS